MDEANLVGLVVRICKVLSLRFRVMEAFAINVNVPPFLLLLLLLLLLCDSIIGVPCITPHYAHKSIVLI